MAMASASAVSRSVVVAALAFIGFTLQGCGGYCSGLGGTVAESCEKCVKHVDGPEFDRLKLAADRKNEYKEKCRNGGGFRKVVLDMCPAKDPDCHKNIEAKDSKPAALAEVQGLSELETEEVSMPEAEEKQHPEQYYEVAGAETPLKKTVSHDITAEQKQPAALVMQTQNSSHQPIETKDPKPAALAEVQVLSMLETEEVSKPEADAKQHHEQHHEVAKAESPLRKTVSHDSTAKQTQQPAPVMQTDKSSHQPTEAKDSKPAKLSGAQGLSALETRGRVSKPASRWAKQMMHINVQAAGAFTKPRN